MTGMEHAIEQVAQRLHSSYCECEGWHAECQGPQVGDRRVARRLAAEGLIAPAPLREEWAVEMGTDGPRELFPRMAEAQAFAHDDETVLHRYRTDWLPAGRAEGDGSTDQ